MRLGAASGLLLGAVLSLFAGEWILAVALCGLSYQIQPADQGSNV